MGRSRYKIYEHQYPYFITSSIISGMPIFSIPEAVDVILDALCFLREKRKIVLTAYVIMEDHIHAIVQGEDLAVKIGRFKSHTARGIIDLLRERGHRLRLRQLRSMKDPGKTDRRFQLWQSGFHPKQIVGDTMMTQKIDYIHANPVKRGYVDKPEHWRYSSARNYVGQGGLIPVDLAEGRGRLVKR